MSKKVLVVDDANVTRMLVALPIKQAGYETIEAVNPDEAFKKLKETKVDMIITDLHMPQMDGLDFIRRLRAMPKYEDTPIIMVTTESHSNKVQEGRAAGANGWIVKPIKPTQVLDVVQKFIGAAADGAAADGVVAPSGVGENATRCAKKGAPHSAGEE
jgi:two-component system chemotaxis response regulator CheY